MYKRLPSKKLSGSEPFRNTGNKSISVLDFWRYGFSNLSANVTRGVLAEFLIENALKEKMEIEIRDPWGDSDILLKDGTKIEVKCCSYIQDWDQNKLSRIVFAGLIAEKVYYSEAVSKFVKKPPGYKSDIYIFALLKHQDPASLDILDLDQWCFYVLTKERLGAITKNGASVSMKCLEKNNIDPIPFSRLSAAVEMAKSGKSACV